MRVVLMNKHQTEDTMAFPQRFFAVCLVAILAMPGCVMIDSPSGIDISNDQQTIIGSGRIVQTPLNLSGFTRISLSNTFKARICRSDTYSVTVTTDDNIVQYVRASQSGNEIVISLANNSYRNITAEITIQTPDVEQVNIDGAVSVRLEGFVLEHAVGFAANGSSAISGTLNASEVTLVLSGSSTVALTGGSGSLWVNGSGAASLNLFGFPVKHCRANLSGASIGNVSVSDTLEVALSGASVFHYRGNPTLRVLSISGQSIIQKVG